ncbi:hypothetical protein CC80DRAFT_599202 [Byssothecium circinans]|uniref:DUF7709 domain-containing protein n=1 Tax=Byssothecium circinans TaxID=147558 RepID=A0A6A5TBH7_9PLEO|nr:hypothetical protein CC80DRAFT_599202 [Byssothecium circinans]
MPNRKLGTVGALIMNVALPTRTSGKSNRKKLQPDTIGALITNIKAYDETMSKPKVDGKRNQILEDVMAATLPLLKKTGLFELFTPDDWIKGTSAGRRYIGQLAKKDAYSNL